MVSFFKQNLIKVNDDLSILFWLKRQKATKEGLVPIYVRITVKGGRTEFSSGKKIHPDYWDEESATATSGCIASSQGSLGYTAAHAHGWMRPNPGTYQVSSRLQSGA